MSASESEPVDVRDGWQRRHTVTVVLVLTGLFALLAPRSGDNLFLYLGWNWVYAVAVTLAIAVTLLASLLLSGLIVSGSLKVLLR